MNIMELGAIGELVGGVAVIGSLIYVGFQVRQSNQINRAESIRAFIRDFNTYLYKLSDNEDIWRRGSVDFDRLSKSDQSKLHWLLLSQFTLGLGDHIASPDRSDQFAVIMDSSIAMTVNAPGFSQWWRHFKGVPQAWAPDYVARIDALAADAPNFLEALPWSAPDAPGTD